MATMNISLPEEMKVFVEEQAAKQGFGTVSEYVRSLLHAVQEQERSRSDVRAKLLEAIESGPATPMAESDWESIRQEVERRHEARLGEGDGRKKTQGR